jgi:hypothetical protein
VDGQLGFGTEAGIGVKSLIVTVRMEIVAELGPRATRVATTSATNSVGTTACGTKAAAEAEGAVAEPLVDDGCHGIA